MNERFHKLRSDHNTIQAKNPTQIVRKKTIELLESWFMSMQVDRLISNISDTIHQKQEEKITQMNTSRLAGLGFLSEGYDLDYGLKDSPPLLENPTAEMVNRQIEISHYGRRRTIDRRLPSH